MAESPRPNRQDFGAVLSPTGITIHPVFYEDSSAGGGISGGFAPLAGRISTRPQDWAAPARRILWPNLPTQSERKSNI